MYVLKRDGNKESVKFDKITARVQKLCYGLEPQHVNPVSVAMKVIEGIYAGVTTHELDNLAAEIAASLTREYKSAPEKPGVLSAITRKFTSSPSCFLEA